MAGWVCQTRKLLQSAIASIADELEQTVQNFNDAVHNLSKPGTDASENGEQAGSSPPSADGARASEPAPPQDLEYDLAAAQMLDLCNQHTHCTDQDFFANPHSLPTTRQPETTGFATLLNSRLSQSSPSLYLPRRLESRSRSSELAQAGRATGKARKFQPLAYRSTSPSSLTVSSPCLIHTSRSTRKKQSVSKSTQLQHFEPEQCNIENRQTSKAEPSVSRPSQSSAGGPHNRADLSSKFGQKLPGKVIRAQRPLTPDELPKDDVCLPSQILSEASTKPVPGDSSDLSPTQKEVHPESESRLAVVQSSVERETRFLRWLTLAPLTRVLSFAFTQFANVVLKLTEEESERNQGSSQRELLAITDHAHSSTASSESPLIHRRLSRDSENDSQEQGQDLYTSLLRSTYSTESFEIIERSCFESLPDSSEVTVVHNLQTGQNFEPRSQMNRSSRANASDILSSSAEFVNFDFKDLIADRQFDKLNPVPLESSHGILPRGKESMYKSYVVIAGDKGPDILVTYNKEDAVEENDDQNVDEREDNEDEYDDDDGSVSFTILSENDEDGFIMF